MIRCSFNSVLFKACGETVIFSYFSMLHLIFFTLSNLWARLNTSTVIWSKLMKAKWRLGCHMRNPTGNWQIKWFVMVEEVDDALWKKLNHEEKWNKSEERFGPHLTTQVCCSLFLFGPAEWGRFMVCYWSRISFRGELKWLQSGNRVLALDAQVQSLSHSHCVQLEHLYLVVMDPAARVSEGTQLFLLFTWVVKEKYRLLKPFFLNKSLPLVCTHI